MKNIILCAVIIMTATQNLNYSSKGIVTLVGAKIAAQKGNVDVPEKKHRRKDCPVCEGKGWYMSGDGIKKIDCTYCEPEEGEAWQTEILRQ